LALVENEIIIRFFMPEKQYVRDEYGGQKIRVGPLDEQAPHQLPKIRKINVAFRSRTLKPNFVRPMRIKEHAKEKNVQQKLDAPCRLRLDGDIAVESRVFGPVMISLSHNFDLYHHTRDVPG
jgi:hypothetical protein